MPELLAEKAQRWDREYHPVPTLVEQDESGNPILFSSVLRQIEYFAERRFYEYAPTATGPYPPFMERLERWVAQMPDDQDQKALLRLVTYLFFVGSQEFAALYRTAYNSNAKEWIIDQLNLSLDDPDLQYRINIALRHTWFCSITDSMQIASFCHVNRISSFDLRPDWRSMARLATADKILGYVREKGIERLCILEDFVGSGTQMYKALRFAAEHLEGLPVLAVPLMILKRGSERCVGLCNTFKHVSFSPVLTLPDSAMVNFVLTKNSPEVFRIFRELCFSFCPAVTGGGIVDSRTMPYHPLGFNQGGGLVVMHTNCPNNTLPIIHHESAWKSLFPRSARV